MECDDTMSTKDMVTALEMGLGLPRSTSGSIWSRVNRIRDFLNANEGYLIIVDEADKLINKYTAAKMEILRGIFDQSNVGIVIAGEPKLESDIKTVLERFANRIRLLLQTPRTEQGRAEGLPGRLGHRGRRSGRAGGSEPSLQGQAASASWTVPSTTYSAS